MHLKYCGVQESSITQYKYQHKPSHLDTSLKQGRYTAWEYKDEDGWITRGRKRKSRANKSPIHLPPESAVKFAVKLIS